MLHSSGNFGVNEFFPVQKNTAASVVDLVYVSSGLFLDATGSRLSLSLSVFSVLVTFVSSIFCGGEIMTASNFRLTEKKNYDSFFFLFQSCGER